MTQQITKKLDHEKGQLRGKAQNPDCRERFKDEGDRFDRGGTHGTRIVLADARNLDRMFRKFLAGDKETAWIVFEAKIRTIPLKVKLKAAEYIFSFKHTPAAFLKANNLDPTRAANLLPQVRAEADQLLRMTKGRFASARPLDGEERDPKTGNLRRHRYLTFKTFLIPAEPQPWHSFFKRLRLDPV